VLAHVACEVAGLVPRRVGEADRESVDLGLHLLDAGRCGFNEIQRTDLSPTQAADGFAGRQEAKVVHVRISMVTVSGSI